MDMIGLVKTAASEWDSRFYRQALERATWSKDPHRKVGAYLVSPDRQEEAFGYNGFPRGIHDTKDRLRGDERLQLTAHAELNAIINARRNLKGWTLYVTAHPCHECAKAILQAGIARVVCPGPADTGKWVESHRLAAGMFREVGIKLDYAQEVPCAS